MAREALLYERTEGDDVRCDLCAHRCLVSDGKRGVCRVRENRGGTLFSLNYGKVSSSAADPVEKKPLYHFHPGTRIMSFGTLGCNFRCRFCQNYRIAWSEPGEIPVREQTPEEGIDEAQRKGCSGVAYTYNEPVIWMEHALEGCREAKRRGLYTAFVTNGYMTPEAVDLIAPHLDAANVDVKAFGEDFYRKTVSAKLEPVLDACEMLHDAGVHLELTYLLVPDRNDDEESVRGFASWVRNSLGPEVPVHFSRFRPMHEMQDLPSTPIETMERSHAAAKDEGLNYVYLGNVPGHRYEDTHCPTCGEKLVDRSGFTVARLNVEDGACPECGRAADVVL